MQREGIWFNASAVSTVGSGSTGNSQDLDRISPPSSAKKATELAVALLQYL